MDFVSGPNRIIMLGCQELLDRLARAELWLADITFKVVPSILSQLFKIHFRLASGINPVAIYCLIENKGCSTYDLLLGKIKELISASNSRRIRVDFKLAEISSLSCCFRDAVVSRCYFHICQRMHRKINEIWMKVDYETYDEIRNFVKSLTVLLLVPANGFASAFQLLENNAPEHEKIDDILSYFEHIYIRGRRRLDGRSAPVLYLINKWNHYNFGTGRLARATNSVEGYHYRLQSILQCIHPTRWKFINCLRQDKQHKKMLFFMEFLV